MKAWKEKRKNSKDETKSLKDFLNDRKPKAFEIESSTERLQAWLENKGSLDTLFTVLGLHEAMDRAANGLLISMNLERWNFVMKYLDKTGHYNLQNSLQETLTALCGNEKWATIFLECLFRLRDTTNKVQLMWLHEMRKPKDIYDGMKIDKKDLLTGSKLANEWIAYLVTYNDLYPQSRTPLNAVVPDFEIEYIQTILPKVSQYPTQGVQRQIVGEILKSWADAKPPPFLLLKFSIILKNQRPDEQFAVKELETSLNNLLTVRLRSDSEEMKLFYDRLKALGSKNLFKRKPESPPENARDRQRSRGE
ncbi:unnamed protein product [Peronospora farinosa]|uniref:Uncharacterized protein n=1 Tax=Peronospora farinosa TaxID=134698 RepID=A0ABN8C3J9_9STRA|nr:unnamed protein product [Peronospora farinosa]